jgi:prephenate dehydratase
MEKITFLGPFGATFTHDAYNVLAEAFSAPRATEARYVPAATNGDVLSTISLHGGFGALAMETLAEARITESLESFIHLLTSSKCPQRCGIHVVGAVEMRLDFCLMTRPGVHLSTVTKVVSHSKSFGACKNRVAGLGVPTECMRSNGEAARRVAEDIEYVTAAALGPRSAAEHYGLRVEAHACEDEEAVTTFFLIAPSTHATKTGERNRMLLTFKVPHEPGALAKELVSLAEKGLNMTQIHSARSGKREYHFAIEIDVCEGQLEAAASAVAKIETQVEEHLFFGPYQVLSR